MIRTICTVVLFTFSFATLKAQTPPVPYQSGFNSENGKTRQNSVRGVSTPIIPATLLLLGLAGGFAGVKIYCNSKSMRKMSLMMAFCCLMVSISANVFGQTTLADQRDGYWNGMGFRYPSSFGGSTPTENTKVLIKNGNKVEFRNSVTLGGSGGGYEAQAASVKLSNGKLDINRQDNTLTVTNDMTVSGGTLNNKGTISTGRGITISGGTFTNNGEINRDARMKSGGFAMAVSGGADVVHTGIINGDVIVTGGQLAIGGSGTVTINNGVAIMGELTITGSGRITIDNGTAIAGGMTLSGGTATVARGVAIAGGMAVTKGTVTIKDGGTIASPITLSAIATLVVESGGTIDLTNATINPNGTLIIEDGAYIQGIYDGSLTFKQKVKGNQWNFFGFPIRTNNPAGIGIEPLANVAGDIWAVRYNYSNNQWDGNYLHWNDAEKSYINAGEGIFAWPDADYELVVEGILKNGENVSITNTINEISPGYRWMALANPYKVRIPIAKAKVGVQGDGVYIWDGTSYLLKDVGYIEPAQGFMVNLLSASNQYTFNYNNLISAYKSVPAERDFLTVSVSTDGYKVPVMFAKNEAAREDYDIFDANKLFGNGSVAEPYLICKGINLCKEEVNSLPYTATMNIKSGEARSVEIIADNIPEGYSLILLDGEEEIAMNQGDIYTVNIASGENADRFKLKIGEKNVSITEVEALEELSIRNNNRNIIIEGGKNIRAEVYNTLGQKLYETTARNFNIEGVAAGAYVIKVQSGKAVQSQKVIIR